MESRPGSQGFVGLVDLPGFLFGQLLQIGAEMSNFVGVVQCHLPQIGLFHFFSGGGTIHVEDLPWSCWRWCCG